MELPSLTPAAASAEDLDPAPFGIFSARIKGIGSRITEHPRDQEVVSGESVLLSCAVFNYSGIVQWTKDGLALGLGHGLPAWPRYRIVGDGDKGEHNLQIQEAELSDAAVYECQATELALRSEQARLTILVPPDEPEIVGDPELLLRAGSSYNLTCRASGAKPAADITWYQDGVVQEGAAMSTAVMEDGRREETISTLPLTPTNSDTGTQITCRASNRALPAGRESTVRLNVHHPPTVTLSIHPQKVREGERVVFTCTANANPAVGEYRWAKGGVPIDGTRGSVYETEVDHTYFTEPVSCEVHNAVGGTNVSSLVDVEFGPRMVEEPVTTIANMGDNVVLSCVWVGNPPLTLTWTRKGSNVVLSNGNRLYLKGVSQDDAGPYVCKAIVPRIGVGEREVTLKVNDVIPVGIIAGVTAGMGALLALLLASLSVVVYRRRKHSRKDVTLGKPDVKVETVNKEPPLTKELEEDDSNISTATRVMKAMYSAFKEDVELKSELRPDIINTREESELKDPTNGYYNVRGQEERPASRTLLYADYRPGPVPRYDPRPPSRLSHTSGFGQGPPLGAPPYGRLADFPSEGADAVSQLSYEVYAFPHYGVPVYPRPFDPYDPGPKYGGTSRYSYSPPQSEHGRPYQQRMQTHV
ncbi:kin of IRRE-like protein 1 isoform X4 [Narcine bancroftii]|uniref:kin of IRRE-like protein 1 isoform X4 n=1 Tax=Narcine bancroftii TaxID=1343680 RepID=UPI0038320D78